jgi:hypothetical protein
MMSALVTVDDDDEAGAKIEGGINLIYVKESTAGEYSIKLTSQPRSNVNVAMAVDTPFTVSPAKLVFSSTNWSTPQRVVVNETSYKWATSKLVGNTTVRHIVTSDDRDYDGYKLSSMVAQVSPRPACAEQDVAIVSASGPGWNASESLVAGTYTSFTLVVSNSSNMTCVNSRSLVGLPTIQLLGDYLRSDNSAERLTELLITTNHDGTLHVKYMVRPAAKYSIQIRIGGKVRISSGHLYARPMEAPAVQAQFSNAGDRLTIDFGRGIHDYKKITSCKQALANCATLGQNPALSWTSARQLIVVLGKLYTLTAGANVSVVTNALRAYNSKYLSEPVAAAAALNPRAPTAILLSTARVGKCTRYLAFNGERSRRGAHGKLRFEWGVTAPSLVGNDATVPLSKVPLPPVVS